MTATKQEANTKLQLSQARKTHTMPAFSFVLIFRFVIVFL
jgi:hypothetical protein